MAAKKTKTPPYKVGGIDRDSLYEAAMTWCTYRELAAIFKVSEPTLHNTVELKEIIESARSETKRRLRFKQIEVAMAGNVQMLIWLGKNFLKQNETGSQEVVKPSVIGLSLITTSDIVNSNQLILDL